MVALGISRILVVVVVVFKANNLVAYELYYTCKTSLRIDVATLATTGCCWGTND